MPLSEFQKEILRTIAANRSPESYVAGATVIHQSKGSPRFSEDVDLFHDVEESVALNSKADAETLVGAGYQFEWILREPTFARGVVSGEDGLVRLEWAHDSAFRFFPARRDDTYGYRLHEIDAAINKMLALAGRQEARDFVDVLYLHDNLLSVGAMTWAACGKDTGYTPDFLLDQAGRHVAYTESDLNRLNLREPLDLQKMKRKWISASERARQLIDSLPPDEIGCLYLDAGGKPVTPDPESPGFRDMIRHRGRVAGAWPSVKVKEG